jgi:DNA-binding GntR family transcriptional regulator
LRDGAFEAGAPVLTTELAARFKISATPIREALSRLVGEGLLIERRGCGFFALTFGVGEIEELYRLHEAYVGLALQGPPQPHERSINLTSSPDQEISACRADTERFWRGVVRSPDGCVLARAHRVLTNQLAVPRLVEERVFPDWREELRAVDAAQALGDRKALVSLSQAYHARRIAHARSLAAALRTRGQGTSIIEQV